MSDDRHDAWLRAAQAHVEAGERALAMIEQIRAFCLDDQVPAVSGTFAGGYMAARQDLLRYLRDVTPQ